MTRAQSTAPACPHGHCLPDNLRSDARGVLYCFACAAARGVTYRRGLRAARMGSSNGRYAGPCRPETAQRIVTLLATCPGARQMWGRLFRG